MNKRKHSRVRTLVPAVMLFMLVLVAWQLAVMVFEVPRYIIPSPTEIGGELIVEGPDLAADLGWTMLEAILGFLVGSSIAIITAIVFVHVPIVERAAFPWAIVLQTVPIVAIAPLLTIWFAKSALTRMAWTIRRWLGESSSLLRRSHPVCTTPSGVLKS